MFNKKKSVYFFIKRIMDIIFGLFGTILFLILLPIVAIYIKRESSGPVFFFQTRVGQFGKNFKFMKFRTMEVNAFLKQGELDSFNETGGLTFKMKKDPRISRIGKLLRGSSLDEIPQFWLVLIGKMSLVGPRPPLITEVEKYNNAQKTRMVVPQGITGLWQVSGRSNLKFDESTNLDVYYALNCSLWLDLKIIAHTIPAVLLGRGAR